MTRQLPPPPNLPTTHGRAPLQLVAAPRRRFPLLLFLLPFALFGYLLLRSALSPSTSPTPSTPPIITATPNAPTPAYSLSQEDWAKLAIEATTVAQELAEIDQRLQNATDNEREQLNNDRQRLQNAAAAIELTRTAADVANSTNATANAIKAEGTTNAINNMATAEAGQIERDHARAAADLAQANADEANAHAATAATITRITATAATTIAAVAVLSATLILSILTYRVATAPRPITPAPTPNPAPLANVNDVDDLTAEELASRAMAEFFRAAEADRRANTPRPTAAPLHTPSAPHVPEVVQQSSTNPVPVQERQNHAKIPPSTPLTPEIKSRIIAEYRAQNGGIRPTSRAIFTYGNGTTDAIVKAVLDEAQVSHN